MSEIRHRFSQNRDLVGNVLSAERQYPGEICVLSAGESQVI